MRVVLSECIPMQAIMDQTWARLSCLQNNTNFLQDLGLALALGNVRAKAQWAEVISQTFYEAWAQL